MLFIKKLKFYSIPVVLLSIFLLSVSWKTNTSKIKVKKALSYFDDKPDFYWFTIKVRVDNRENTFKMVGATGGVRYGKQIVFEKELWHGLSRRQLTVGPFESKREAMNAKKLYKSNETKIKLNTLKEMPNSIHWFAITFEESPRLRIYVIKRAPGAVASGSLSIFIQNFYIFLQQKLVGIGPFENYEQAELAKRLYRMNE